MRRIGIIVLVAAWFIPGLATASDTLRIQEDLGGQIGPYLNKYNAWKRSGKRVVIDGTCLSACTIVLGIIPRDRMCMTSRARLGFHAAWRPDFFGRPVANADATKVLMDFYPTDIRAWLARQGGLSKKIKYLNGADLAAMYPVCR